jgi:release factor glutamine methyltransferase
MAEFPESSVALRLRAAGCVFAEDEARLLAEAAGTADELARMVDRRVAGLPLEQILGWVEFCGLRLELDPDVFVPRRRTEFLVRCAVPLVPEGGVVVDLCCGCGALGTALGTRLPGIEVHAADIDPAATACARGNLARVGGQVYCGDLFAPLPTTLRGRIDVLVANVPYVPTEAIALMPPEARDHEPRVALDGGTDGLDVARRVIAAAPDWLAPGGSLLFETSESQTDTASALLRSAGMLPRIESDDDAGATVAVGTRR